MKISFLPEALSYFNELSEILYEKEYCGFEYAAVEYVDNLIDEIKASLPNRQNELHHSTFKDTERICFILSFGQINILNGMFSSISTKLKMN
ncbi:MAG: hypothetical protein LBI15_05425 [Dysgonamonadaceae bacterium]|jgi:hypothetical protein|nr:hypothetical protein [Dysgonamonadaceae bacterium]